MVDISQTITDHIILHFSKFVKINFTMFFNVFCIFTVYLANFIKIAPQTVARPSYYFKSEQSEVVLVLLKLAFPPLVVAVVVHRNHLGTCDANPSQN